MPTHRIPKVMPPTWTLTWVLTDENTDTKCLKRCHTLESSFSEWQVDGPLLEGNCANGGLAKGREPLAKGFKGCMSRTGKSTWSFRPSGQYNVAKPQIKAVAANPLPYMVISIEEVSKVYMSKLK
ncbi:unnamed protein product [Umbelopsis ramanniana]